MAMSNAERQRRWRDRQAAKPLTGGDDLLGDGGNVPATGGPAPSMTLLAGNVALRQQQTRKLRLANDEAEGRLVRVDEVRSEWSTIIRDLRAGLLAVPARLTRFDRESVDAEIRAVLTELGDDSIA